MDLGKRFKLSMHVKCFPKWGFSLRLEVGKNKGKKKIINFIFLEQWLTNYGPYVY